MGDETGNISEGMRFEWRGLTWDGTGDIGGDPSGVEHRSGPCDVAEGSVSKANGEQ